MTVSPRAIIGGQAEGVGARAPPHRGSRSRGRRRRCRRRRSRPPRRRPPIDALMAGEDPGSGRAAGNQTSVHSAPDQQNTAPASTPARRAAASEADDDGGALVDGEHGAHVLAVGLGDEPVVGGDVRQLGRRADVGEPGVRMGGGHRGERSHEPTEMPAVLGEAPVGPVGEDALEQGVEMDGGDQAGVELGRADRRSVVADDRIGGSHAVPGVVVVRSARACRTLRLGPGDEDDVDGAGGDGRRGPVDEPLRRIPADRGRLGTGR